MKSMLLASLIATTLIVGCTNSAQSKDKEKEISVEKTTNETTEKPEKKELTTPMFNGMSFVKSIEIDGDEMTITYYKDFDKYQKNNPKTEISEQNYIDYWNSDDSIEKALFNNLIDLLKGPSSLQTLNVTLPFGGQTYSYSVTKQEVTKYTEAETYTDELRKEFIREFVGNEITADDA